MFWSPPHNPNFSYNFEMPISASYTWQEDTLSWIRNPDSGTDIEYFYSGTLVLTMTPAIPQVGFWGSSRFPVRQTDGTNARAAGIQSGPISNSFCRGFLAWRINSIELISRLDPGGNRYGQTMGE